MFGGKKVLNWVSGEIPKLYQHIENRYYKQMEINMELKNKNDELERRIQELEFMVRGLK